METGETAARRRERDRDRRLLYTAAFLRALATGTVGVLLGIYLEALRFEPSRIGLVIGLGLAGAAMATLLVTLSGDRVGRRRFLLAIAVLAAVGTAAAAVSSGALVLGVVAFVGMLNGMGRDRGAALVLEQAILPSTTSDARRTRAFAVYNVVQDVGHALGSLCAGMPALLRRHFAVEPVASLRWTLAACALLFAATIGLYLFLSKSVESATRREPVLLTPASRRVLFRISSLFAIDGVAGGFLTTALLSLFFHARFGVEEDAIGVLFFGARIANAISHLGAAWLARRIGLVNTMVFTHIPSSLLLVTVPFAPSFGVAAVLFLFREGLVEMDVPTRQSYVMAVVRPEERTVASGVTHLVRLGAWAVAPSFAGLFMQGLALATPILIGAGMKITYDVLLYAAFRRVRPPEESGVG